MRPDDLEALVDRELRRLPLPRAPRHLLPRVMAAVHAAADRPWYARPWFMWPVLSQIASIAALALVGAAAYLLLPAFQAMASNAVPGFVTTLAARTELFAYRVQVAATAFEVVWRTLLQPIGPYAFALVATMCLACGAFGAALNQVVLGRGFHR